MEHQLVNSVEATLGAVRSVKRLIIVLAIAAVIGIAGCALFVGPPCDMGFLTAISHPFTPCDKSGD